MLVRAGFALPWTEDVLVPATRALAGKEFAGPVEVGKTDGHVAVRCGPWTAWLKIDREGRYPDVDNVLPKRTSGTAVLTVGAADASILLDALPGLPGNDPSLPVELVFGPRPRLVARDGPDGEPEEVALTASAATGPTLSVSFDRAFLAEALKLGARTFEVRPGGKVVVGRDGDLTYAWIAAEAAAAAEERRPGLAAPEAAPARQGADETPLRCAPPSSPSWPGLLGRLVDDVRRLVGTVTAKR